MDNRILELAGGDRVELADARGTTLRVDHGTLWLTQEGDRRDIVLGAGDAWTIERKGLAIAQARGDTALRVTAGDVTRATVRTRRDGWKALLDRVHAFGARTTPRNVPYL